VIVGPDDHTTAARKRLLKMLELLRDEGYLKNNCELVLECGMPLGQRFLQVIRSMKNLEKLDLFEYYAIFSDLVHLFQSCPKMTHLRLNFDGQDKWDSEVNLSQDELRLGFQKLQHLEIAGYIVNSGNIVMEILPYVKYYNFKMQKIIVTNKFLTYRWLKECSHLTVHYLRLIRDQAIPMVNSLLTHNLKINYIFICAIGTESGICA
jgi:hypothetical protein